MGLKSITDQDFDTTVSQSEKPILVDFWAEWCPPCRALGPKLEQIADEMGGQVQVVKLNIDENPKTPEKFGIRSIPTMILFKNGQNVEQMLGNMDKQKIVEMLQRHT
jgi:thioredoxin 1